MPLQGSQIQDLDETQLAFSHATDTAHIHMPSKGHVIILTNGHGDSRWCIHYSKNYSEFS